MREKYFLFVLLFILGWNVNVFAQVAINTTGDAPDNSAMLDIHSTEKGLLIPRMTKNEREAIDTPATGLLVFQTDDTPGFFYFDGNEWVFVIDANHSVTKIDDLEDGKSDSDGSNDGSSVYLGLDAGTNDDSSDNRNVGVGFNALYYNTIGEDNVALGHRAMWNNVDGNDNVAIGKSSLQNNTEGDGNVAIGYKSLNNNQSGNYNVGIGKEALNSNTSGENNVAIGKSALKSNTEGDNNIAIGLQSLTANDTGYDNTSIGSESLFKNDSGSSNTSIGRKTLRKNTSGSENTAIGSQALAYNTEGSSNTAIGYWALKSNQTGEKNTAVGFKAFQDHSSYSNSTALGSKVEITASNQVRIGDDNVTSIGGYANWTNLSDGRFKTAVTENVPGLALIEKLRPVTYHLNLDALNKALRVTMDDKDKKAKIAKESEWQIGFIAQDVEKAAKDLNFDFHAVDKPKNEKDFYGLRYAEFVPVLVKAMQEQQMLIEKQKSEIESLKNQNREILKKIDDLQQQIDRLK